MIDLTSGISHQHDYSAISSWQMEASGEGAEYITPPLPFLYPSPLPLPLPLSLLLPNPSHLRAFLGAILYADHPLTESNLNRYSSCSGCNTMSRWVGDLQEHVPPLQLLVASKCTVYKSRIVNKVQGARRDCGSSCQTSELFLICQLSFVH